MNYQRDYINPKYYPLNMDKYILRSAIVTALKSEIHKFSGVLLDVGCGFSPYKSIILSPPSCVSKYVGLDLENNAYQPPDLTWDGDIIPLEDNSIGCAMATEVLEHCLNPQQVLDEVFRVLKPGGLLFLTTPFVWPLHDTPSDYYRYTPYALDSLFGRSGFVDCEIRPLGGWNAVCAQMLGLWIRRSPMPVLVRNIMTLLAYPFWMYLLLTDKPAGDFSNNTIFCGLRVVALKSPGSQSV